MDRTEKPKGRSRFANSSQVKESDALLVGPTGREGIQTVAVGRSAVTGRHDLGSGANETADGLTALEEEIRRGAEDLPLGAPEKEIEDLPVFDRGSAPPKV